MAKVRYGQKPDRVYKFLMGARHAKVAHAMKPFGFSDAVLQEGWKRLQTAAELELAEKPSSGPNPKSVEKVDNFENVWFVVAKATLKGNYPSVHDELFAKLSPGSGRDSAMTVGTFLKRLREMEAGEGVYAENGTAARELLVRRGLTESIVAEAETLVATVKAIVQVDESKLVAKAAHKKAVDHLWAWYLEWSAIARVAVKERGLLRSMGFRKGTGGGIVSEAEEAAEMEEAGEGEVPDDGKDDAVAAE